MVFKEAIVLDLCKKTRQKQDDETHVHKDVKLTPGSWDDERVLVPILVLIGAEDAETALPLVPMNADDEPPPLICTTEFSGQEFVDPLNEFLLLAGRVCGGEFWEIF